MKRKLLGKLTFLLTLVMHITIYAQQSTISGTVTDNTGLPLPGVNIVVKGTNNGTQTDFDGKYSITANQGDVLLFSYVGFADQSITVGANTSINVQLEASAAELEEVVVVAYGDRITKTKLTTSVVEVSNDFIENRPNANVLNSLQGQAAGVNIAVASGQPGTNKNNVFIRGVSSLGSSTEPLYVIDGVPLSQGFLRNFNQNEIASVTVLKDAAATSIYGNRGTNGVIVITTKTGKFEENLSIGYSSSYGFTDFIDDDYNLGSALDQLRIQQKGFNEGVSVLASAFGVDGTYFDGTANEITLDPNNLEAYSVNTDWQDLFFRTGTTLSHDINVGVGGKNFSNYTNAGYFEQEGIVPTSTFQRFTVRNNFTGRSPNEKFNYSVKVFSAFSKRRQLEQETRAGIDNNVLQNPLTGYLGSSRFLPANLYENGTQLLNDFGNPSLSLIPYMLLDLLPGNNQFNQFQEFKTLLTFDASYKITDDISFGITTSGDFTDDRRIFAIGPESYLSVVRASGAGQPSHGIETIADTRNFTFVHVNNLSYNKLFTDKHDISLSLSTEYTKAHYRFNSQTQVGLNPLTWSPGAGTGYIAFNPDEQPVSYRPTVNANDIDAGLFSYFATSSYDYDSKYGFTTTIRRDGSFRFTEDNRWGTFWAVSGRWNLDKETFLENNSFINSLKLRASYGTTGNQFVVGRGLDSQIPDIFQGNDLVRDLNASGTGANNRPSFFVSNIANPNLVWETTGQFNVGIDFGLLENRFTGAIDYYNRLTTDLFQAVPVSFGTGVETIRANDGALRNEGLEFQGRFSVLRDGKFNLDIFGNIGYNDDKFTKLGAADSDSDGSLRIGTSVIRNIGGQVREWFLVPYEGVNPDNGNLLFTDIDGNSTESPTDGDRVATGKSLFPTYQGGFGFEASYEGFFLNTLFVFAADQWRVDGNLQSVLDARRAGDFPVSNDLFDAWTEPGQIADIPALAATNIDAGNNLSDRFLRDASYLRLRNITLGYSLPSRFLRDIFIKQLSVRVVAENYLTFTKWRGLDPERIPSVSGASEGSGIFPSPKILTVGLDIKF
ncbi:SusC/RagA family TonB-linked outer membrane protein [Aquimarina sp. ERC-38]|uniref:SusC/RagA family TonB-linked outer membrane protein n=1 Tax=Aquimarina sp. ERC-38 TaxID=2949996 RepID=UPI00224515FE|nr:SusC/RagA family TonB-linked outer membrane protein [Aquimarina sp. ERC-38]UZO80958.1 SusC/RagA family TonB-linked outer membrane protein [Aquimarina sp. ERC-38]